MAIEKSEIKMELAHELGVGFDDALERAQQDVYKAQGAKIALAEAAKAVGALAAHIKRDLKEEKFETEAEAQAARTYVRRAEAICDNLRLRSEVHEQRAEGRVEALKSAVKITKKLYDNEEAKLQALKDHDESEDAEQPINGNGRPPARPVGARPPARQLDKGDKPDSSTG